jgi:hypothetical protein
MRTASKRALVPYALARWAGDEVKDLLNLALWLAIIAVAVLITLKGIAW